MNKEFYKNLLDLILSLAINTFVIMLASKLFENFEVSSIFYAFVGSIIISVLNKTIKPLLKVLMLPVTILSLGLLYPFTNVVILKLTSLILGDGFIVIGWIIPFFIAIFMSIISIILDELISKPIKEIR